MQFWSPVIAEVGDKYFRFPDGDVARHKSRGNKDKLVKFGRDDTDEKE